VAELPALQKRQEPNSLLNQVKNRPISSRFFYVTPHEFTALSRNFFPYLFGSAT
jgi:hypothetical protein